MIQPGSASFLLRAYMNHQGIIFFLEMVPGVFP